jgi:hypothetical protein
VTKGFVTHVFLLLPGRGKQPTSRYFLLIEIRFIAIRTNTKTLCVCANASMNLTPLVTQWIPGPGKFLFLTIIPFSTKLARKVQIRGGWIEIKTSAAEFSTPPEIK